MLALYAPGERAHGLLSPYLVVLAHGFFLMRVFSLLFFFFVSAPMMRTGLRAIESLSLSFSHTHTHTPSVRGRRRARDLIVVHALGGKGRRRHREFRVGCALARGWRETPQAEGRGQGVDVYIRWSISKKYYRIVDRRRGGEYLCI